MRRRGEVRGGQGRLEESGGGVWGGGGGLGEGGGDGRGGAGVSGDREDAGWDRGSRRLCSTQELAAYYTCTHGGCTYM